MKTLRWIAALIAALALPAQAELRDIRYDYQRAERAQTDFTAADAGVQRVVLAQLMLAQFTSTNPSVTGVFNPASPGPIGATTPDAITGTTITATTKISNAAGSASGPTWIFGTDSSGWYRVDASRWAYGGGGGGVLAIGSNLLILNSATSLGWVSGSDPSAAGDVFLTRDAANTLACRNGTNACLTRIYNTYTDASNYERLDVGNNPAGIGANTAGVLFNIAGTGAARNVYFGNQANGAVIFRQNATDRWQLSLSGHFVAPTDNTYDIGATGATRPRDLFLARQLALQGATNDTTLLSMSGASITGSGTTSHASLAGTWNTTGVVPGFILANVTNTASGAGSRILELQRGGVLQFGVTSGAASTGTQIRTAQATVPTCGTNCGTPNNVCAGSDTAMICTMGTTPASGFVITFNGTWATAPACTAQAALTGMATGKKPLTVVTTTTTITVVTDGTAPATSDKYAILCMGVS